MVKQNLLTKLLLLFALIVGSSSVVWGQEVTLDFTNNDWGFPTDTKTVAENSYTANGYTIKLAGTSGNGYRWYSGDKYLLNGKSGATLTLPAFSFDVEKIEVVGKNGASGSVKQNVFVGNTAVSTETTGATGTNTYIIADGYQTAGNVFVIKVTSSHNTQYTAIKIYKKSSSSSVVAIPTFNPAGGNYTSAQNVTISCATEGATIRYTTNGVDPTENDPTYSTPISVTASGTVIKAKAFKADMDASSVATATYTIKPNEPTIEAAGSTITITGDDGCTFYYTTNGDTPTNESTHYTAPFTLESDCTIKAISYDTYGNSSNVETFKFKYMPLSPININSGYYVKVTDVSTLENGDAILIVNEAAKVALGPQSENGNNCTAKDVTITNQTISEIGDAQKIVLVKVTEKVDNADTEVFYFYTGAGYLYASSNSSNYLKLQETPTTNARATISISNGDATITFKGSYTHNLLKYNETSKLFSCYASGQKSVQIYKEVPSATITAAGYATFSSDKNVDFSANEDLVVYTATDNGSSVTLNEVESKQVPANNPVVLKGAEGTYAAAVIASAEELGDNDLRISNGTSATAEANIYVLANKTSNGVGFYKWAGASSLSAGKIYLQAKASSTAPFLGFDGEGTTGINSIERTVNDSMYYSLDGRRVAQPTKGLYIVNGKKVIIK